MATAEVESGICGYHATVRTTTLSMREMRVEIESDCPHVQAMAEELTTVDPFGEISFRGQGPVTLRAGAKHLAHAACPVPIGVIKAIEVEAGLALPKDASISPAKD